LPQKGAKDTKMKNPEAKEPRRDRNGLVRCRVCGCTEADACIPPCSWEPGQNDLCTTCAAAVDAMVEWANSARRANMAALRREFLAAWGETRVTLTPKGREMLRTTKGTKT
jgi:hypothetical protein